MKYQIFNETLRITAENQHDSSILGSIWAIRPNVMTVYEPKIDRLYADVNLGSVLRILNDQEEERGDGIKRR